MPKIEAQRCLYPAYNPEGHNPYTGAVFSDVKLTPSHPLAIPGLGHITNGSCGEVRHAHVCPSGDTVTLHTYQCHNYQCPICYPSAAHKSAVKIEDRVQGVGSVLRLNGIKTRYPNHIIISPPVGAFEPSDSVGTWRKKVYKVASDIGIIGGVVVFHPYRIKPDIIKELNPLNKKGDSGGFWRLIHSNVLNFSSWRDYVQWSPHFHILGFLPDVKIKSSDLHLTHPGWFYKTVQYNLNTNNSNKYAIPSVAAAATYLLTHHGYVDGRNGYNYFGILSPQKASVVCFEKVIETILCAKCGQVMHKYTNFDINADGTLDLSRAHDHGEAEHVRIWSVYKLKGYPIIGSVFGAFDDSAVNRYYNKNGSSYKGGVPS
ncbi:MAG: hypothetical protein RQ743_14080 [Bacteroidales bacterium]|nr:hypothetical protein [Bacteroidales bacterium]